MADLQDVPDGVCVAADARGQLAIAPGACRQMCRGLHRHVALVTLPHSCHETRVWSPPSVTCSALPVAEVALRVQLPADHQGADVAATDLHRLPCASTGVVVIYNLLELSVR